MGQRFLEAVIGVEEDLAGFLMIDLVEIELERRHAAPHPQLEPPLAQVIEHTDLLGEPERRIERQQIDQWAHPHLLRGARHRRQPDPRFRHHVEARRMVLRGMKAVKAGFIGGSGELKPFIELGGKSAVLGPFKVVE